MARLGVGTHWVGARAGGGAIGKDGPFGAGTQLAGFWPVGGKREGTQLMPCCLRDNTAAQSTTVVLTAT